MTDFTPTTVALAIADKVEQDAKATKTSITELLQFVRDRAKAAEAIISVVTMTSDDQRLLVAMDCLDEIALRLVREVA